MLRVDILMGSWSLPPQSLERRSVRIVSRYIVAFAASYGAYCVHIALCISMDDHSATKFGFAAWRLLNLNGLFNFVALHFHAKDVVRDYQCDRVSVEPRRRAASSGDISVGQVSFDDRISEQITYIHAESVCLWAALGTSYEDGVSGYESSSTSLPQTNTRGSGSSDMAAALAGRCM